MANARSIVVAGSLNADLVVGVPRFPLPGETLTGTGFAQFPGGKGANQAYAAARLGGAVRLAGQVGQDDLGTWLLDHLASARVDVSAVGRDTSVSTGLAIITVDATGQNSIVLVPGANGTFVSDRLGAAGVEWAFDTRAAAPARDTARDRAGRGPRRARGWVARAPRSRPSSRGA